MLDPVAVRSYLSSLGQQQGGASAPGGAGVQAMLANLRQRLYGPQAQQQLGAMGQGQASPAAGMPNGVPPRLQEAITAGKLTPEQAQQRYAQFQAGTLPGQQGQPSVGGGRLQLEGPPMISPGEPVKDPMTAAMPDIGPGGAGGSFSGGGQPYGADAVMNTLPATFPPAGQVPPGIKPALQGAQTPNATPPSPQAGAANVSAAMLGADQFRGPNARRILGARQGIFNNVRQALRSPRGAGSSPSAATGGKVGRL